MPSKRLLYGLAIGVGAAVAALLLWSSGLLDGLENITWGWRVKVFAGRHQPSPDIKVVLIDQYSLDWGKKESGWSWPWPREVYTTILDFAKRGGAKAVALDMLYTEPSVYQVSDDEALGAALARSVPTALATFLGSGDAAERPAEIPDSSIQIEGLEKWLNPERAKQLVVSQAAFPVLEIATNASVLANVSDIPDDDTVFRRALLFRVFDGHVVPALGFAPLIAAARAAGEPLSLRIEEGWLHVGAKKIPIDELGRMILYYKGAAGRHETYNAASIVQSELRLRSNEQPVVVPSIFQDAYVFFGTSAPGLLDLRPTPVSRVYPGVEIYATMLDNILSSLFLRDVSRRVAMVATVLLALFSGILAALSRKAWHSVVAFAVFLPVPLVFGFVAYAQGYWWPIAVGEASVAFALVSAVVVNYATEGRQKAFIKKAFGHYVGAQVMDELLEDPTKLKLGGEKRELSMYFSDIEKFSTFSEKLDPQVLTSLLNDYLTDMTNIILEEGGYLDKYVGDAIVAFWNAPVAQPDHAMRAVRSALRCQRKLAERREELRQRTGATVKMRIGLNTGDVTVGNMGSLTRFNYTVLGDAANLASRLEGANKAFGTYIMVSESTWDRSNAQFIGRETGRLTVVGRKAPERVYEVVGFAGEPIPAFVTDFQEGLRLVYEGKCAEALALFEKHPDDPPSRVYAARCRLLLSDPAQKWDGIWNLTEK